MKKIALACLPVLAIAIGFYLYGSSPKSNHTRDYAEIVADGTLRAAAEPNALTYRLQGDTIAGFYADLIGLFARSHGLNVELIPESSYAERMKGLNEGRFDIIVDGTPVTSDSTASVRFTHPLLLSHQTLVQRRAGTAVDGHEPSMFIRSQTDLAGKTLHVTKGSPAVMRIRHMSCEIGDTIYIYEEEQYSSGQLIAMVANGDIDYAVCDRRLAELAADSLPQIDIYTPVSFNQFQAWTVGSQSPVLLDSLNVWLDCFMPTEAYHTLYRKYFSKALRLPDPRG